MKKTAAILLAAAMLMTLTACSLSFLNKNVNVGESDKPAAPIESQEPTIPDAPADAAPDDTPDTLLPDPDPDDNAADTPAAPEEPAGDADQPAALALTHTDVTLRAEGETFTLNVKNVPGTYACTFTSNDPSIATVDEQTGLVTAVSTGKTTVTAHLESELGQRDFECIVRCAWKTDASQPASGEDARPSLSGFFSDLQGSYEGLGAMMVMDSDLLDAYYPGLSSAANVEEILIQETMITISNVAIGLVKLSPDASADDVIAVQNILQSRIDAQADGGAFYPDSCETWKAGIVTSVSNCVGMFVYPENAQDLADDFIVKFSA